MIIIFEIKIKPFVVIKLTKINKKPSCLLLDKISFTAKWVYHIRVAKFVA